MTHATCTPEVADFIDPTGSLRVAGLLVCDHLEQLTHTILVRSQLLIGKFALELMWLLIGEWGSFANIPELDCVREPLWQIL